MKRKLFMVIGAVALVVIGVLYWNNISYLEIEQDVIKISVRNGNDGENVAITNPEEIEEIIHQINLLKLKRSHKLSPATGWEIILDFYSLNNEITKSLVIRDNGIEYNGYFYGDNAETAKLLNLLKQKFD